MGVPYIVRKKLVYQWGRLSRGVLVQGKTVANIPFGEIIQGSPGAR
jgi:hypothetical protein